MIRLRDISRTYRVGESIVTALNAIDLDIEAVDFVALVGPSGSGKTTLMNLIGGLDRPSAGSVAIDGRELTQLSRDELARYRRETAGFVFQSFRLLSHLTALENVALPRILAGRERSDAEQRAAKLLARVGLADRGAHRPPQLSMGEQQRVAVARALANGPRMLLADEPTGNLDAAASASLLELLAELRESERLTVLVATHDAEIAGRADRVVRLRAGRISQEQPSAG